MSGFLNANRQPLRNHEDIIVFSKKQPIYHPQMVKCPPHKRNHGKGKLEKQQVNRCYGNFVDLPTKISDEKYPKSVLDFDKEFPPIHPTQKPVALLEWLIKTYTETGATVLDNCMGSGSTGVACLKTGRRFIGMELEQKWFQLAVKRITDEMEGRK